jgi:hypothetical protein
MEFNYPYWVVEQGQAGQAWNAVTQPNLNPYYPNPSYHPLLQSQYHPILNLPSVQSWQNLSHPSDQSNQGMSVTADIRPVVQGGINVYPVFPPWQHIPTFTAPGSAPIAGVASTSAHQHRRSEKNFRKTYCKN